MFTRSDLEEAYNPMAFPYAVLILISFIWLYMVIFK